jgi:glutaryl-CoA dehydrogenase (non-decarboxylating)
MTVEINAARLLCMQATLLKKEREPDFLMETCIAKFYSAKTALNAANHAVQIFGANGCSDAYPLQRYLRDAKITDLIEGSAEIQKIIISQYAYQKYLYNR